MPSTRFVLSRRALIGGSLALLAAPGAQAAEPAPVQEITVPPLRDPSSYRAYIPAACKAGQYFHYTCEFDAAWAVMKSYGVDSELQDQLNAIGLDDKVEPNYVEQSDGVFIYGGDIEHFYCGDYTTNFLARTRTKAMRKVFTSFGLSVRTVTNRKEIEECLDLGRLIFIKTTVDFKDWVAATWVTSGGARYPVVLGNDHAVIVMGYDDNVVLIRDVLGPTSTNYNRQYEYEVAWDRFLTCWGAQGSDGQAVWKPAAPGTPEAQSIGSVAGG